MEKPLIVLVGDSIRLGYQPIVTAQLGDAYEVWGPEENGGNSANVIRLMHQWCDHRQPQLIHFNCGLHDIKTIFYEGTDETVVPIEHYVANLRTLVRHMRERTHAKLIWASTTPVIDADARQARAKGRSFTRFDRDVVRFNAEARRVMEESGIPIDDLYTLVAGHGTAELQKGDGVHYHERGNQILGEAVTKCILANL